MHERKHARRRMLIALALFMALGLSADGLLLAEAEPEPREIPAAQEEAPPEKAPPEKQADEQDEPQEPERLPLNLRNAGIDQIIQFLSEHTGKVILKSKDVQAQINLSSPEPVTPERAIELIFNALRLEGVAVVEREGVIHLLPEEKAAELGLEQRVLDIKFADVAEVEELVKPLLGDKTKLVADPRSNKVIVSGPAEKIAELADLVAQIDVLEIEGTQVHIFQLEHAEAEELAAILKAVLADGGGGGAERPGGPPGAGGAPVAVVAYPSANWIVVRAPKDKLEAAKALVEELDREKPPELELSVVAVEHADAAELARRISELFAKRRRTEDVSDQVELTADERSNALIVLSTQANYELIKELVSKLDTEESRAMETRSYVLQYADAEDVAQQLNDLYGGQQSTYYPWYYGGRQEPQTQFVAERRTNSLIVIAPPADFEQMEALIEKLDQPIDAAEVAPRIYHIENMDAKEMTDVLNQIFGTEEEQQQSGYWYYYSRRYQQEDQIGRLYGKVRFVHEPSTNSIIVITNNAENFRIIEELLERLDRPTPEYANTLVYQLKHADAVELADRLNTLFAPPGVARPDREGDENAQQAYYSWLLSMRGQRGQEEERPISNLIGKVRVVPDSRINALLITTSVQHFNVLRQLIEQLDVESPKVLLRVRLVELTRTDETRVGTRWTSDSTIFETDDFNNGLLSNFGVAWEEITTDTVLTADFDVSALVQFLERRFDAHIVSEPSLSVNNNREATVFVGAEVPFITETQREPGTTARNDAFEYREVGTKLVITPHINKEDNVVTEIQVESSQIRPGEVLFGGFILDTRTFESELAVEDGQTIVIGGIFRQNESETVNRVPILGHIPLVGLLFSKKDTILTTTELIAFITPHVMRTAAAANEVTRREAERVERLSDWLPAGMSQPEQDQ